MDSRSTKRTRKESGAEGKVSKGTESPRVRKTSVASRSADTLAKQKLAAAASAKASSSPKQAPAAAPVAKKPAPSSSSAAKSNVMLLVGTYHSVLAGLVYYAHADGAQHSIKLKFSVKHHNGCVNDVAKCGKYIASSGSDERMFLFTAKDQGQTILDLGALAPASEVRCIGFPDTQFLVCGCEDGTVATFKTRTWDCVSVVPVHEKAIIGLAIHPSAPLGVTVGNDRQVAVIDLQRGALVTRVKLPKALQLPVGVKFNADGSKFAVALPYEIQIYDTMEVTKIRTGTVVKQLYNEIHAFTFVEGGIVVGCENSKMRFMPESTYSGEAVEEAVELQEIPLDLLDPNPKPDPKTGKVRRPATHKSRIRVLVYEQGVLFSADTDGIVCGWNIEKGASKLTQLAGVNCGGRITTMIAAQR